MLAKASAKLLLFFDIRKPYAYFFAFLRIFLKNRHLPTEIRHALKSQINTLYTPFSFSLARDYMRSCDIFSKKYYIICIFGIFFVLLQQILKTNQILNI